MNSTRRAFLAGAGSVAVAAVAGCLGSDDGEITLEGESELPVPVAGDPDADVTVMAFEDFSCKGCQTYQLQIYPSVRAEYVDSGKIRYEHRDYPRTANDEWSWKIAGAARSVQDRGDDGAFWAFTERIYVYQDEYSNESIADVVEAVNEAAEYDIDPDAVLEDVASETYRDAIEAEADRASDAGVEATPTVVVDGQKVDQPSFDAIESDIEDAL